VAEEGDMIDPEACLTASDLIAYSAGRLEPSESSRIAVHMERCPRCQTALERIAGAPTAAHEVPTVEKPPFLGPPLEAGDLGSIDHYRVVDLLGQGGMGSVFKGIDTVLQRSVAIKVLKEVTVPFAKERMLREAQVTAALSSEHVAAIYQVGQINGLPYLAMELLEGESLEARLAKGKPGLDEVLRWSSEIAEGLAAAHAKGLVHRDIKPANIWILPSGKVKILDFGLSRPVETDLNLTQTGYVVGTPHYMSPEQATDGVVDHRSDLFSLGCVMYRMVTGGLAFPGRSFAAVIAKLATFDPPPVTDQDPAVPHALSDLIGQLLAKKPEHRPASASEVVERLLALKAEPAWPGPVVVDAGRTTVRARAPLRARAPWQPWVVGAGTLLAAAIVGVIAWQFVPVTPRSSGAKQPTADAIDKAIDSGTASPTVASVPQPASSSPVMETPPPPRRRPAPPTPPAWNVDTSTLEKFETALLGKPGLAYLSDMKPSGEDLSGHGPLPGHFRYPVVAGSVFSPHGIFQHGRSPWYSVSYTLDKKYSRFWSKVAVNDSVREKYCDPFYLYVYGDGKELWHSPKMTKTGVVEVCDISVKDVEVLKLLIYCERSLRGTHAAWIEPSVSQE
jgi:serine/threonine protein kinase